MFSFQIWLKKGWHVFNFVSQFHLHQWQPRTSGWQVLQHICRVATCKKEWGAWQQGCWHSRVYAASRWFLESWLVWSQYRSSCWATRCFTGRSRNTQTPCPCRQCSLGYTQRGKIICVINVMHHVYYRLIKCVCNTLS